RPLRILPLIDLILLILPFSFHPHPTPLIYTLSLHDALPISAVVGLAARDGLFTLAAGAALFASLCVIDAAAHRAVCHGHCRSVRSEEHTSELQSPYDLVCRLLLEKKKNARPNTVTESERKPT